MLGDMGWRIIPAPLALPMLPRSERKIPAWVLSTMVLMRIEILLRQMERRFAMVDENRSMPRGSINWARYATHEMSRAHFLNVPCRFPDLREDRDLKGAIRFALNKQLAALDGQRTAGVFVLNLISLCQRLLDRVSDVPPAHPAPRQFEAWLRGPLRTDAFRNGLQAVEWTVDDRGLAGLSDLQGLPWVMAMEEFFEAWVEVVAAVVARRIGGIVRTGRQHQTNAPISWSPPYLGSQKALIPDVMLEHGDTTFIIDAKYKEHWEELTEHGWRNVEDELRERHRADLLQVLAYANLAKTTEVVACLAYPCSKATWTSLKERGRLFHRASIPAGERRLDLILTALPMGEKLETVASELQKEFLAGR
jgi:5-methylcytosine-specific restriction endonuclease McrBC regulatory subunit McrC